MKFFLDNCLSPKFAKALRILAETQELQILHLSEKFELRSISDEDWMKALGQEKNWIIVSGDTRISKRKVEKRAWRESNLTAFFFDGKWASQRYWKQAEDLIRWWPRIVQKAKENPVGAGYLIPLKGREFKVLYTPDL